MTNTTTAKKKRGLGSLVNSFVRKAQGGSELIPLAPIMAPAVKPLEVINRMIARGITLDVADDDFEICGEDLCTAGEKRFLESNRSSVLCQLQFGLLNEHLFKSDHDRLSEFLFDIEERRAILGTDSLQIGYDVTARWYNHLLEDMEKII